MKFQLVLIFLLCVIMPLVLASDTQKRIKVYVFAENMPDTDLDDRLEAFIKREFRALGDVDVVNERSDCDFLCLYTFLDMKFKDGRKTDWLAITSACFRSIPKHLVFDGNIDESIFGTPLYFRSLIPAHWEKIIYMNTLYKKYHL